MFFVFFYSIHCLSLEKAYNLNKFIDIKCKENWQNYFILQVDAALTTEPDNEELLKLKNDLEVSEWIMLYKWPWWVKHTTQVTVVELILYRCLNLVLLFLPF